jgi:hypothetical protein
MFTRSAEFTGSKVGPKPCAGWPKVCDAKTVSKRRVTKTVARVRIIG